MPYFMRFNPFSTKNYQSEPEFKPEEQVSPQAPKTITVDVEEVEAMRNMIMLAGRMRSLLQKVRYESLPMSIAKEIDTVLRDATNFD